MNLRKITLEHLAYGLAFLLALIMRLLFLGASPLSEPEANWALQAFSLARGDQPLIGPQPGYILLTGLLFSLAGNDNFLARLVPALAGSLLVFFPYLFRSRIGTRAALLLAFGLALDPGLVALSRQAGSPILAVSFLILALASWLDRKPVLAGLFGGLALLGGPALWEGLLGLAAAYVAFRLLDRGDPAADLEPLIAPADPDPVIRSRMNRVALLVFTGTVLLAGTLFFQVPRGLGAAAGSLPAYLQDSISGDGLPLTSLLIALVAYEPLALLFGIWAGVRGWIRRDPVNRFCSLWFAAALFFGLIIPGRQVSGLVWALIPAWILAARQLASLPGPLGGVDGEDRLAGWVYTLVVLMVIGFIWLNFTGFLVAWQTNPEAQQTRGLALTGGVILLALATLLVTWGWSSRIAAVGLLRGAAVALFIYLLSVTTASAGLRIDPTLEYWASYPRPPRASVLLETYGDLSAWRTGRRDALDLVAVGIPSPALRWILRNLPEARFSDQLGPGSQPSVVITGQEQEPALAASYRGESIPWLEEPDWAAMSPFDRTNWIAFHRGPQKQATLILWARTDLFPDLSGNQAGGLP